MKTLTEIQSVKIRSRFSPRERVSISKFDPSKAKQQFREDSDVNVILRKYKTTGILPELNRAKAHYGDFSNVADYQTAMQSVMNANAAFEALPSEIRTKFQNDPAQLISFVTDSKNREQAIALGLVQKPAEEPSSPSKAASSSKKEVTSNASDGT